MPTDYGDYIDRPEGNDLKALHELIESQHAAQLRVDKLNEELNEAQQLLKQFSDFDVPECAESLGLDLGTVITTTTGLEFQLEESIHASASKERMPGIAKWMRDNGQGKMLKHVVSMEFSPKEDELAQKVLRELRERHKLQVEDKTTIHPSTLKSFVKRSLREGKNIPMKLLGVHRRKVSKVLVSKK